MPTKSNKLYIQLFSIHGLIRGSSPELGRDADTGGQVKYVIELAKALGSHAAIERVDLFTRLIEDRTVSRDYAKPVEVIDKGVRIIRIRCGGKKYIRKELLWPYLGEFIDETIKFIKKDGRIPDIAHGHYADAGYVASEISDAFEVPFLFTGHSLGRNKQIKLIADGLSLSQINKHYNMEKRISTEESIIKKSDYIFTSTQQEIEKQYKLYNNFGSGRFLVNPPGIDTSIFYPYYINQLEPDKIETTTNQVRILLIKELYRFWLEPQKPFILALCRPDRKKNIKSLIDAYGRDKELQGLANMAIFAGIRKDIKNMEDNERNVLTDMLLRMDYYDLYGKLAIPKKHDFETEVPELYRLCADSHGVFTNPALVEPFGLTILEASSCGLPVVTTNSGGPVEIIRNCKNGIHVDVTHPEYIAKACKEILVNGEKWEKFSQNGINGVRSHYSWDAHALRTLTCITKLLPDKKIVNIAAEKPVQTRAKSSHGIRLTSIKKLLITDIDNTFVGDSSSLLNLLNLFKEHKEYLGWGVATGRTLEMTLDVLSENNVPLPDIIVSSVGSEIYYGPNLSRDKGWKLYLQYRWSPEGIRYAMQKLDFLSLQEVDTQRQYKISYYMKNDKDNLAKVFQALQDAKLKCQVIFSHGQFLDILPLRASKGRSIKYLSYKWGIDPKNIMVAGDSGNDEDMLTAETNALVVGNHSEELDHLKGRRGIYFSKKKYASGIIDGLRHYGFL